MTRRWRRKSVKIFPGIRINFNKKSKSITFGHSGTFTLPEKNKKQKQYSATTYRISGIAMYILCAISLLIGIPTFTFGGFIFIIIGAFCLFFGWAFRKIAKDMESRKSKINGENDIKQDPKSVD